MEDDNKLIAEFMGYKLTKCNRGQAWERPTLSSIHDDYKLHGRLWVEKDSYYKWDTSWDWLMPVVQECYKHKHENALLNAHCVFISAALQTVDRKTIYETVVNFIQAYNKDEEELFSDCCGVSTTDTEMGICPDCLEHCEFITGEEDD